MTIDAGRPEFSRPLTVRNLPDEGALALSEKADVAERAALAARLGVPGVKRFGYTGRLTPIESGFRVEGTARARLIRTCVVSLETFDELVEVPFLRDFIAGAPSPDSLDDLDPDAEDPPEPLGEVIDPADIAAEAAALALDPYPRKPDAAFDGVSTAPEDGDDSPDRPNPFAGLAALKAKMGDQPG